MNGGAARRGLASGSAPAEPPPDAGVWRRPGLVVRSRSCRRARRSRARRRRLRAAGRSASHAQARTCTRSTARASARCRTATNVVRPSKEPSSRAADEGAVRGGTNRRCARDRRRRRGPAADSRRGGDRQSPPKPTALPRAPARPRRVWQSATHRMGARRRRGELRADTLDGAALQVAPTRRGVMPRRASGNKAGSFEVECHADEVERCRPPHHEGWGGVRPEYSPTHPGSRSRTERGGAEAAPGGACS